MLISKTEWDTNQLGWSQLVRNDVADSHVRDANGEVRDDVAYDSKKAHTCMVVDYGD